MWWGIAIVLVALGISAAASAETLKNFPREETPETWRGKTEPPERMKPRPKFKVGQKIVDTSSGKSKEHVIEEIKGYKNKYGKWKWDYYMTDHAIANEQTLSAAK